MADEDEIKELVDMIRPTDAPPADDRDDAELMKGFARKFRGSKRALTTAFAEAIMPGTPAIDGLADRSGVDRPDRELDLPEVEDIDTLGYQLDVTIKHLRALRDRVAFEAERRGREDRR